MRFVQHAAVQVASATVASIGGSASRPVRSMGGAGLTADTVAAPIDAEQTVYDARTG